MNTKKKAKEVSKEGTPNADYLYGLIAEPNQQNTTISELKAERLNRKYKITGAKKPQR